MNTGSWSIRQAAALKPVEEVVPGCIEEARRSRANVEVHVGLDRLRVVHIVGLVRYIPPVVGQIEDNSGPY